VVNSSATVNSSSEKGRMLVCLAVGRLELLAKGVSFDSRYITSLTYSSRVAC